VTRTLFEPEPVAAAYVGFRHWHVDDGRLFSIGRHPLDDVECPSGAGAFGRIEWPIAGLTALPCRDGASPGLECTCGIYATNDLRDPGPVWRSGPHYAHHVIGAVALWGRVVEHEIGFRAQHARPVALLDGHGAQDVAERYGIPTVSAGEATALAGTFLFGF
jgi:hypothetical protein